MAAKGFPCDALTLHQPWASLLVNNIKRVEGRSWRIRGPFPRVLWIHAAAREPTGEEVEAVEAQYRALYDAEGVDGESLNFPSYPLSCLLGCVTVAEVVTKGQLQQLCSSAQLPETLLLESDSAFQWLCYSPQKMALPWRCSGKMKLWTLPRREVDGAAQQLEQVALESFPNHVDFQAALEVAGGVQQLKDGSAAGESGAGREQVKVARERKSRSPRREQKREKDGGGDEPAAVIDLVDDHAENG